MLGLGVVFGLCKRSDREQQAKREDDRLHQVEEREQQIAQAHDPRTHCAGEEDLRNEAIKHEQQQDELGGGAGDLREAGRVKDCVLRGIVRVKVEAEEQGDAGERELAQDGGGERGRLAAEAQAGLQQLLPRVDVVLVLAGEKLAHLGVDAIDVGREGEDAEQRGD